MTLIIGWSLTILYYTLGEPSGDDWFFDFPHFDKVEHFGAFFILAFLTCAFMYFFNLPSTSKLVIIITYCTGLGALIEYLQLSIPGRSGDLVDLAADTVGVFAGIFATKYVKIH